MGNSIVIKYTIRGIHYWPNAPDKYSYLQNQHRHIFHFEVSVPVDSEDREIEIIEFKETVKNGIKELFEEDKEIFPPTIDFESYSCESLAQTTFTCVKRLTGKNCDYVKVLEDNENGAIYWG